MYTPVKSLEEFNELIETKEAVLFYFSHEQCNVCKVLKPKIHELITNNFPKIELYYCDTVVYPELAAQNSIFAVPTLVIYFGGRETIRKSRNLGIEGLSEELDRPYQILYT